MMAPVQRRSHDDQAQESLRGVRDSNVTVNEQIEEPINDFKGDETHDGQPGQGDREKPNSKGKQDLSGMKTIGRGSIEYSIGVVDRVETP